MDGFEVALTVLGLLIAAAGAAFGYLHLRKAKASPMTLDTRVGPIDASTRIRSVNLNVRTPPPPVPLSAPAQAIPPAPKPAISPVPDVAPPKKARKPKPRLQQVTNELCNQTIEVENASYEAIDFELEEGDFVKGVAEEAQGQEFSVYVYDEDDYAEFVRSREPQFALFESEDERAHVVEFKAPADGTYYIVLDTYGKVNDRTVKLRLKSTRVVGTEAD